MGLGVWWWEVDGCVFFSELYYAGTYKGRKKINFPKEWEEIYNKYKTRDITATKAMEILNLKRTTFYKLKNEYENK